VLDGEIVCLGPDGRSRFNHLLFRRDWPHFMAFDVLWLDGRDLRCLPLIERKSILKRGIRTTIGSGMWSTSTAAAWTFSAPHAPWISKASRPNGNPVSIKSAVALRHG
jgi:ATP-dependent DNA ligase